MEGVAGITQWEQVNGGAAMYEEGRRLYMNETNAAIRGCKKAGATEIVAIDGHGAGGGWTFNSWIQDKMEAGAEYITGYRWGSYVEGMKAGIDAVLLPGAHAMAGTPDGVLCHTISSTNWVRASINGVEVGESGLVAAIAGSFNVPVIFVSGDTSTCKEVTDLLGPNVVQACVKKGLGRYSARSLAHADACALIEEKAAESLSNRANWPKPYNVGVSELKIELHTPDQSVQYLDRPGIEVVNSRTVISRADNFWQAWDQFWRRH
jgi:D-amino peptidase